MKTATKKIATYECPKCSGTGHIPHYSGIANGVCFKCAGAGKLTYKPKTPVVKPLTEAQAKFIETVKTADLSGLSYGKLLALRNSSHWHYPQCPDLLKIWKERGEAFFQAAQETRLEEMRAARAW